MVSGFVASPAATCNTVVDVPEEHVLDMTCGIVGTIDDHAETTVDDFAPSYATAVVDADPSSTAETIANDVLDSHIGRKLTT